MDTNKYIFISSSSRDKPLAEKIASEIEDTLSIPVWMDSKSLVPGSDWENELEKALKGSAIVLTLLSNNYLPSKWFLSQAQLAIGLNIPLIPLVIDRELKAADTPEFIQKLQFVYYPDQKDKLYEAITIYLRIEQPTSSQQNQTKATGRKTRKSKVEKPLPDNEAASNTNTPQSTAPVSSSGSIHPPDLNASQLEDKTPFHKDSPSSIDYLGRKGFVEAMAEWLSRYWEEYKDADKSFVVNLHGQWGAGKTTFLNLLQQELQKTDEPPKKNGTPGQNESQNKDESSKPLRLPWIVIWFNAWENRHIKPEWWPLMDRIYRDSVLHKQKNGESVWRMKLQEWWWRFYSGRKLELVGFMASSALLIFIYYWVMRTGFFPDKDFMSRVEGVAKAIGLLFSAVSTIFLGTKFVSQSLVNSGSARAAEVYLQFTPDPIDGIKKHFDQLIEVKINQPVIVFVDDLDRCDRNYLVNLLESIQTLLNHRKVFYVIAADQRWLFAAFEETYKEFKDSIKEPGKKIGYLFLEKIFQLSMWIPNVADASRAVYLNHLLGREDQLDAKREQIKREVAGVKDNDQAMIDMIQSKRDGTIDKVLVRDAVVAEMASLKIEKETTHFLSNFAHLMDPNPRTIKRLVTFFGVLRAIAIQRDEEIVSDLTKRNQLALWTIVRMRWPLLADYLEEYPQYLENFKSGKSNKAIHTDVMDLIKDQEVMDVLRGKDVNGKDNNCELDAEALRRFILLKATERTF